MERELAFVLAMDHRWEGTLIGHVGLSPFEGDVEIGFAVAEAYQRQGLAVEAVVAVCRWAFIRFGLSRVLAITAQSNRASRAVLARAGFQHQGDRVMRFQATQQGVSLYCLSAGRDPDEPGGPGGNEPTHLATTENSGRGWL